jgi:hypothetical protein
MSGTGIENALARVAQITSEAESIRARFGVSEPATPGFAGALQRAGSAQSVASGPTSTSAPNATVDRETWAKDLLRTLGMPVSNENVRAIVAWEQAEGTSAGYNPLATTQSSPGATDFNSVGVKNYSSYSDGIDATVKTLTNGLYDPILAALRRGSSADDVANAVAASPWGTGQGVFRVLHAQG